MKIRNELFNSMALAILGLSLIAGGTNAYFNDTKETTNTVEIGLMNLGINKESIIHLENFIPGDTIDGDFELTNDGSIDMRTVNLHSSYEIIDKGQNNNGDDLGAHIVVECFHQQDNQVNLLFKKKLSELNGTPIQIADQILKNSAPEKFTVRFSFIDNGENQNHFQGDTLNLKWEFEANQLEGKSGR